MTVLTLKLAISLSLVVITLIAGLMPFWSQHLSSRAQLLRAHFFSRGIFLGVGLLHLLPNALHHFGEQASHSGYLITLLLTTLSLLIFKALELSSNHFINKHRLSADKWLAYFLLFILSIHSVIAGAALGLDEQYATIVLLYVAILAHKGAAAFALATNMCQSGLTRSAIAKSMALFSIMTPMGILLGSLVSAYIPAHIGPAGHGLFDAIAAGTFIFIALFHEFGHHATVWGRRHLTDFSLGVVLMGLLAFWL